MLVLLAYGFPLKIYPRLQTPLGSNPTKTEICVPSKGGSVHSLLLQISESSERPEIYISWPAKRYVKYMLDIGRPLWQKDFPLYKGKARKEEVTLGGRKDEELIFGSQTERSV